MAEGEFSYSTSKIDYASAGQIFACFPKETDGWVQMDERDDPQNGVHNGWGFEGM